MGELRHGTRTAIKTPFEHVQSAFPSAQDSIKRRGHNSRSVGAFKLWLERFFPDTHVPLTQNCAGKGEGCATMKMCMELNTHRGKPLHLHESHRHCSGPLARPSQEQFLKTEVEHRGIQVSSAAWDFTREDNSGLPVLDQG